MKSALTRYLSMMGLALIVVVVCSTPAHAQLKGAIFTTLPDGSAVNYNIYGSKLDVYLDGGPPPGAPSTAAGLPDGTYVFQVTDPSGKTLLSQDAGKCRQFTVVNGNINGVVVTGCQHVTGFDAGRNSVTVQLMPYADTPNNGGEYKAWATPVQSYIDGCTLLGVADPLNTIDCGLGGADFHGFIPSHSKTDNFKARTKTGNREIDTNFNDSNGQNIPFICETWIDTLGVSNTVCATSPQESAKVEDVETGVHHFVIFDQPGCTVGSISVQVPNGPIQYFFGAQTIEVKVPAGFKTGSIEIYVSCI